MKVADVGLKPWGQASSFLLISAWELVAIDIILTKPYPGTPFAIPNQEPSR